MAWEPWGFGLNCCSHAKRRLSSRNLKTASDVLCDKSYVTAVHSQRHKKRIHNVIHLNPLRRTVFHIQYFLRYTHSSAECFVSNDMAKNLSWTKTNSLHISVLETLTGTPYRQRFFYRNGVPGRSGLLSPLNIWMSSLLAQMWNPPIEDFLATVLHTMWGIDWKLSVMSSKELEESQGDLWSTYSQRWKTSCIW